MKDNEELKALILKNIQKPHFSPKTKAELFKALKLRPRSKKAFSHVLNSLIRSGLLQVDKNKKICKERLISGIFRANQKGFGFVCPTEEDYEDIFVPQNLTLDAADGDLVLTALNPRPTSPKGPDGKIVAILKRARRKFCGIVKKDGLHLYVPILGAAKSVCLKGEKLNPKEIVWTQVENWKGKNNEIVVSLIEKIGTIDDPIADLSFAIKQYDLLENFSKEALLEAGNFDETPSEKELQKRADFTHLECITVDPENAKDFDDALSLSIDEKGNFFLGVHIADVAHFVKPNSLLDKEALKRCNSTYLPGKVLPMLPEKLSNGLCSLKPGVIRLTISVLMNFDSKGELINFDIKRSFIKSQTRFTYGQAFLALSDKMETPHLNMLKNMEKLALLLKAKRSFRGSIDFSLPEVIIKIDEKGAPTSIEISEYDISHQMVEEFMLKANEIIALHLSSKNKEAIYRVHEEPAQEDFGEFYSLARSLGYKLSKKPSMQELAQLFSDVRHTAFAKYFSIHFIRSLKLATYSLKNVGHFGLALSHYCHFTSPIRRYPDLVAERLLFEEEKEDRDLEKIAQMSSEHERQSAQAENFVIYLKKLRLLKQAVSQNHNKKFTATITKIKPFFLFFEVDNLLFEGSFHVSEMKSDYFLFDEDNLILKGKYSGKIYSVGSKIEVKLLIIDLINLKAEWSLV